MNDMNTSAELSVRESGYKPAGQPNEYWNTPLHDLQTRLEMCAGSVKFERACLANARRQLEEARALIQSQAAEIERMRSEMQRFMPLLERLVDLSIWDGLTAGLGIATINAFRDLATTQPKG